MAEGIEVRHAPKCRSRTGGRCNCSPGYRAKVWDKRNKRPIRETFTSMDAAKSWRADMQSAMRQGKGPARRTGTLRTAAADWLRLAGEGVIRNRSGDRYKPSALRGYEKELRLRVLPKLGDRQLGDVQRLDIQDLVDELVASGVSASTVQCSIMPLRAIYRRALARGDVMVNPTTGLELPAVRSKRDRIASPDEAAALLAVVPEADRAIWATAMYAGLRTGELRALRWEDVDLSSGVIRIEHGWDACEGEIPPKSAQGRRRVPIPVVLRDPLMDHRLRCPWRDGLVFGASATEPFADRPLRERAREAWKVAKLEAIGLHECRHTFASLMIAAGVNAKALSRYMGHYSVAFTYDRYGHLMRGNEDEAAALLDAYLLRAAEKAEDDKARAAEVPEAIVLDVGLRP